MTSDNDVSKMTHSESGGGDTREIETARQIFRANERLTLTNRQLEKSIALAEKLAKDALKSNEAQKDFLANMSFEMRTPLNTVVGLLDLLMQTDLDGEQLDYVETCRQAAGHIVAVMDDVLDFSQIESRGTAVDMEEFNLFDAVHESIASLVSEAQEKGVELVPIVEASVPQCIKGNRKRLVQLINKLVDNGVRDSDRGDVIVRVATVEATQTRCALKFSVSDSGIGLSDKQVGILKEAFGSRGDDLSGEQRRTMGVGLTIARQLSELLEVAISLESDEGQGSTFSFVLEAEQGRNTNSDYPEENAFLGRELVFAVQNEAIRQSLSEMVAAVDCTTSEVLSAEALSDKLVNISGNSPRSIIVLDVEMPGVASVVNACDLESIRLDVIGLVPTSGLSKNVGLRDKDLAAIIAKPVKKSRFLRTLNRVAADARLQEQTPEAANSDERPEKAVDKARSYLRVLVVEDNRNNQKVAASMLKKLGCAVDVAVNGQVAVELLRHTSYDLVLMDVQMPVMDGRDATRTIRDLKSGVLNHNIPIVATTAHAFNDDKILCIEAGMNDYLPKPIDFEKLKRLLKKYGEK